jgi:membrane protease YdiL (CAAX protease family)
MLVTPISAYLLAGFLALGGVALSPMDRWAFRAGASASRKFVSSAVTIVGLWTLTAVAIGDYGWTRLLIAPVPAMASSSELGIIATILVPVLAAFFLLALLPLVQSLRGPRWRRAYDAAIRRYFANIPGFVPNTAAERSAWIMLSLTAAFCEEVLFRGFLIRFLHEGAFVLPVAAALSISCLFFGLGHSYQGLKGVLQITAAGFAFGLLFLLTGSLLPCFILHAVMDLQMIYVVRPIPELAGGVASAGASTQ